jgi:hypothetical protein
MKNSMKKYSAKKKRRTCKKGGTQTKKLHFSIMQDENDSSINYHYAIIYNYNDDDDDKVYFCENINDLMTTYKVIEQHSDINDIKLIKYKID